MTGLKAMGLFEKKDGAVKFWKRQDLNQWDYEKKKERRSEIIYLMAGSDRTQTNGIKTKGEGGQ